MGSCENLTITEKPLCGSVIEQNLNLEFPMPSVSEQQSCSEAAYRLFESNVDPTNALDGCPDLSRVVDSGCVSSGEVTDATEVFTVNKDGLVGESQNLGDLTTEKVLGSERRISGDCFNEIRSQGGICNLETGAFCLEKSGFQGEDDCETPLESMPLTGSQGNCVQLDELVDKTMSGSSPEGVMEVTGKQSGEAGLETDTCNPISPSLGCENALELIQVNGLPSNYAQQNVQGDTNRIGGLSLEDMDGKIDVCNRISPLQDGEMPLKFLHAGDLVSNSDWHSDQKYEETLSGLSAETVTGILQTKSNTGVCIQVLPSQGSQRALENLHMAESLSISFQQKEQGNDKTVDVSCAESVAKAVEQKSGLTTCVSVESGIYMLPLEENSCILKESAANIAHHCNFEKSVLSQSCQPFSPADYDTLKDMPDQDIIASIHSSSVVGCSGHTDNEGKDNVGFGCVFETKCPEIVSSSTRRNGRRSKSSQKTNKNRAAKKCKRTTNVPHPHGSIGIVVKAVRMRRSCLSKRARSSDWGLLGNITQFFKETNGLDGLNVLQNQGLRKARGGRRSGKQNKKCASGSSRGSSGNNFASTSRIRLKVKVGKVAGQSCLNNMVSEVVDMSASANATTGVNGTDYSGTSLELPKLANCVGNKLREDGTIMQLECFSKHLEKEKTFPDAFVMDRQLANKDSQDTNNIDKVAGDSDDYLGVPSNVEVEALGETNENRCTDPGTSPDSEVINLIPDAQVTARHQADFHDALLTSSKDIAAKGHRTSGKRGKKDRVPCSRNSILEDGSSGPVGINKAKTSKKHGSKKDMGNGLCSGEILTPPTSANTSSNLSSNKKVPMEPLVLSRESERGVFIEALKEESGTEAQTYCNLDVDVKLSESHNSKNLHPSTKGMGRKLPKSGRVSKGRSKASESASGRGNARRQREKPQKSVNKCKAKEKGVCNQIVLKVESHPETGSQKVDCIGKTNIVDSIAVTNRSNLSMVPGGIEEQCLSSRKAWVLCDDCHKWRRIPALLADSIEKTNCTWTCKDNTDKPFADCSIPQEKSNAEINAELDISDASGEEDANDGRLNYKGLECMRSAGYQESTFKCVSTNEFLHRWRRTQTIDEVMVCHCKPPPKDRLGCRDECLNRMLNIECVQGTCPCGDLCSNQQFQKQKYARLEWFRSGKKGYGLKLLEDIRKGQFLIEYVGEVLDMHAYEARQKDYALKGHRHFYFMTLNGSEVIDACAKGNLGRFINHSCDPNCRTEKWMVNGEICIGLFALRNIKKGEEVTFDYNYVRVFGAAAKKCYCGAPQCRGFIGGDLHNSEVIVQGDSDDEFPEPVMLLEDGESGDSLDNMIPSAIPFESAEIQTVESVLKDRHGMDKATTAVGQLESTIEKEDSLDQSAASQLQSSLELEGSKGRLPAVVQPVEISHPTEDVIIKSMPAVQLENFIEVETMNKASSYVNRSEKFSPTMTLSKSLSAVVDANMKSKSDTVEDKRVSSKSHTLMKVSRPSTSVKKGKASGNHLNTNKVQVTANKSQVLSIKPKKLLESSSNGRSEAVEEKLNELLDTDGGISKRKDAPKGYLKLLLLTAASGDSGNGEAIQSNRDLSMILDALLKTKSRAVLIDIINKNGLRMLHNIMKQYRRDFKKIPILRKLLKVLEYLAVREILTPEHINGGPPCPGMESFRESILSLTEHDDKQVHQIARNFRDRWIPRPVRKLGYLDRDDGRMEIRRGSNCNRFSASHNCWRDQDARPTEAIDCVKQTVISTTSYDTGLQEGCSAPCASGCQTNEIKTRKRKSRWDQPAETNPTPRSPPHKELRTESTLLEQFESRPLQGGVEVALDHVDNVSRKNRSCPGPVHNHCQKDEASGADNERQNIPEDVPPGFSSPPARGPSTAIDLPRQNVHHRKRVFDAIIGQPQEKFISRLPVSYGIPLSILQQFGTPQAESWESWVIAPGMPFHPFPPLPPFPRDNKDPPPSHPAEGQRDSHCPAPCYADETTPCLDIPCANSQQTFKRARESSCDLGKRYFRQEKRNNTKLGPPWLRKRNVWGHMGDNSRGSSCSIGIGNVANEQTDSYLSQDVSSRVDKAGGSFYQQHQNHH